MGKNTLTGFTILELVIVVIIIGVLATLALTQYGSYRENVLNKEAQANLKLIIGAQRSMKMDTGGYYVSGAVQPTAISNINTNLKLLFSTGANRSWDYLTTADNTIDPPVCCAQATRNDAGARKFRMRNTETEPVSGVCP